MRSYRGRIFLIFVAFGSLFLGLTGAQAADPEIDRLLRGPIGKDWVTNGGNLTNQRYSTLKQIDTTNVKQLKGAWMTRLKGSGLGGKYSLEASPLVKDGIMYVITGNDDVFALDAKTGAIIWEYWSGIDQNISTVCCGWVNRGLAMGEGLLFFGQLDANVVAIDMKTGKLAWKTPIEKWENGYGITSAPLYYDGIVYSGITGGEFGVPGRRAPTMLCAVAPRSGTRRRSIPSSALSTSRSVIADPITTGRCARATTCSARRWWRSRPRPASMSGTSSRCITTSGTMTRQVRSCCSTPLSMACRAKASLKPGEPGGSISSTAPTA